VALFGWLHPTSFLTASTITYIQGNYATPQTAQTKVIVTFTAPQAAGDLNVVVVGWNDSTSVVRTVSDKSGNTYARAIGPTVVSGSLSQSIYYAKNIGAAAAGANSVTVSFSAAAASPDIRILQYRGVDPNSPVDVAAAGSGSTSTSSTATARTSNAADLIFGANTVRTLTIGPGSSFTRRLLSSPDGDIAEDRIVTATGSYSATAPLNSSGPWVMQMVAFRSMPEAFSSTSLSLRPSSLNFGNVVIGSTSALPVLATNTGKGSLTLSVPKVTGTAFSVSGFTLPLALSAGQTKSFSVDFHPTTAGSFKGSISLASNAANSPTVVMLSGTAVKPYSVSLTWRASTSSGVIGYNVYRRTSSGSYALALNSMLVRGTTYTDTNVPGTQTYYYVATAVNSGQVESSHSNETQVVLP
jgi:hypothetical protein